MFAGILHSHLPVEVAQIKEKKKGKINEKKRIETCTYFVQIIAWHEAGSKAERKPKQSREQMEMYKIYDMRYNSFLGLAHCGQKSCTPPKASDAINAI